MAATVAVQLLSTAKAQTTNFSELHYKPRRGDCDFWWSITLREHADHITFLSLQTSCITLISDPPTINVTHMEDLKRKL